MILEEVSVALFRLLEGALEFGMTGRRVLVPAQVTNFPAMFLRDCADDWPPRSERAALSNVVRNFEVWIYSNAGKDAQAVPAAALNELIFAVLRVLQPGPGQRFQTLGLPDQVHHCWVEGLVDRDPGDAGPIARAVIDVKVLVPLIIPPLFG